MARKKGLLLISRVRCLLESPILIIILSGTIVDIGSLSAFIEGVPTK